METVKDVFSVFRMRLTEQYQANEIESITSLVLSNLLNTTKAKLKAFPDHVITQAQQEQLQFMVTELATGKPVQYILGQADFYDLMFKVNPSVLIPRPETEELVEWILSDLTKTKKASILDIGTGSGCIPITLKKKLPAADVYAIDISIEALQTAAENAALNQVDVNFIKSDILTMPHWAFPKLDVIVSNPPYVTPEDMEKMHMNVTDFEPHLALFVPQDDPLLFYDVISDFALLNLKEGGNLFFEINESYGKETVEMLQYKRFKNIELRQDLSARDRMIKAQR